MLALLRKHPWWFLLLTAAAAAVRLFFVLNLKVIEGDSQVYGELARGLATQHFMGLEKATGWVPTMIRMPGYPIVVAFTFLLFGVDNYAGVMYLQIFFDVATCFLIADLARRCFGERAARSAFLLAAFCPFLLNYVATPLTECLETFCTAAALDCAMVAFSARRLRWWALAGVAVSAAIYLRPDGGLLLGCLVLPMMLAAWLDRSRLRELTVAALLLSVISLAPLSIWTVRNYRLFHVIQPLVDPHAADPGEYIARGWERWCHTWFFDYAHSMDIGFPVPGEAADVNDIPGYAYSNPQQRATVKRLFEHYNVKFDITPEMDREFDRLAAESLRERPFRYRVLVPSARVADMWLRPRTEMMPLDVHFWRIRQDPHDAWCSIALGVLNLVYLAAAAVGVWLLRRQKLWLALLLTYPAIRSLFLGYIGANEDRYTIECIPMVLVLAGGCFAWWKERRGAHRLA